MDRKALICEYKESLRPMGVYRVHNIVNDKSFVGTSTDLPSMLNRQQAQLRMGRHPNLALQRDWNQLGADGFEFEILDTLTVTERSDYDPTQDLRALEELWLEKLSTFGDRRHS